MIDKAKQEIGLKQMIGHLTAVVGPLDKVYYIGCSDCYSKVSQENYCNKCKSKVVSVPYYFMRAQFKDSQTDA